MYVQSDTSLLADVFGNFRDKCIEIYELDLAHFLSAPGLLWQACLKKTGVKLELLTDNDMLIMYEEETRGGMCHATYRYAKANNKYMKNYDINIESSFLEYDDANNLCGWAISQKLPLGNFEWIEKDDISKFDEKFIKNYDENSDKGYILEVDVEYPKNLHKLHNDLPFLPERMKINKCSKLACTVQNKEYYVIHVRNPRDIKLVTTNKQRRKLASEPNFHSTKYISKDLLIMEMKKVEVKMNKPIYLGQAILDISKTLMYEFWYNYIKPKYRDKARLCYMDTDSFVIYIKTEDL